MTKMCPHIEVDISHDKKPLVWVSGFRSLGNFLPHEGGYVIYNKLMCFGIIQMMILIYLNI